MSPNPLPHYAQAWNSIRIHRRFARKDIQMTGPIGEDYLRRYLLALRRAGYIRQIGRDGDGDQVYLLVRDTGPHAPVLATVTVIRDPNTGEEVRANVG